MSVRCGICSKTINNSKERLHIVSSDAENKIKFGYYSEHKQVLNGSLCGTKIHERCYKIYYDRWYNKFARKKTNDFQNEISSITNENHVINKNCLSSVSVFDHIDNHDDDVDDDIDENNENKDEFNYLPCSTAVSTNLPILENKKDPLTDISNNIYFSSDTINFNETNQISSPENLFFADENNEHVKSIENYVFCENSPIEKVCSYEQNSVFSDKKRNDCNVDSFIEINSVINTLRNENIDAHEPTETSDLCEEPSCFVESQSFTHIDHLRSATHSQSCSLYTSTPKVISSRTKIIRRCRQQSEEDIVHPNSVNDRSLIFVSPLDELHAWLGNTLRDGRLIPLVDVQHHYQQIMKSYSSNNPNNNDNIRCDMLRKQLESKFPNQYHFETVSKRNGTYIALNDISLYSREAIHRSQSYIMNFSDPEQTCISTTFSKSNDEDKMDDCEKIFDAIRLLRTRMKDTLHILEKLNNEPQLITELTNNLFADCIPVILRNFIGLLTASDRQFVKLKMNHGYYDFFNKDLFQNSSKSLKNTVICHDILNARYDHIVTPKHILLANEICKHGRSNELLCVLNRFGHVASYEKIYRIHRRIANNEMLQLSLPSGVLPNCYIVQVADNFDLNRETLHGERSYHFLNRIFVQTPENNFRSNVVDQSKSNENPTESVEDHDDYMHIDEDTVDKNDNHLRNTNMPSFDEIDVASHEFEEEAQSNLGENLDGLYGAQTDSNITVKSFRAADEALRDHSTSFYHDYTPFVDRTLAPHLLAYGFIKAYFDRLGQRNLPLYSGFMAIHLPNVIRPRHKVTYMSPINQDPNKLETAETCMIDIKKILIESCFQKNAVLVVDERIYRLCIQMKDENWSTFENIFVYPGDFHMMKCSMTMIWNMLEGSGIDTLFGYLYKGATLKAVLTVAHFNKSLRAIKILYTALIILLQNEYAKTFSSGMIDEIEQLMKTMPQDLIDVDSNKQWYASVLQYLSKSQFEYGFNEWIQHNCENNLKFRFWIFVIFDLITPLIKLYTSLRTGNFNARNAAVCELAELFFVTNHRYYARLTARHLSDLRVCPEDLFDHLEKSFAVVRTNRNFSSIALDQTIEVTINKMGKGHGGITGRCSANLIDVWSNSFTYRCLLSSITHELAGIESASNSVEAHIECSSSRMDADRVDLQIILDKLADENLFSVNTNNVTQILTGKIIHKDIIESICQSRVVGAGLIKSYIQERLVNCSTSLNSTLHASSLRNIWENDTYNGTGTGSSKRSKKKSTNDLQKTDVKIRHALHLSEHRSIDLVSVFAHEFSAVPFSLCSLDDTNLLNQQSKSRDTFDCLKEKFPLGIYSTHLPISHKQQALVVDASSLLHINPCAGSSVSEYSIYLFDKHILPLFTDYSRVDLIFDSCKSQELKSFTHRYGTKNTVLTRYEKISSTCQLPVGRAYQSFVVANRARLATAITECWKEPNFVQKLPSDSVLLIAGPSEKAIKLEKDQQPMEMFELESNHIEADSRLIVHLDHIIQSSYSHVVVKSIDTDVTILCIYYASLSGLEKLFVDATVTKNQKKIIDCTYIHNELIDKYHVNPLHFLIVYALSGCDTCSFIRNVSKKKFMQTLFESPADYNDLEKLTLPIITREDIGAVQKLFIRCFDRSYQGRQNTSTPSSNNATATSTNQRYMTLNQLRVNMALNAFKQNKTLIITSLPPTEDALFHHCLRVSRQVRIWLQAPDPYINYPDVETSGFEMVDGCLQVKWASMSPMSSDRQLSCCGKHKGQCTKCVCIINKMPCTLLCQCSSGCPNRNVPHINTHDTSSIVASRSTTEKNNNIGSNKSKQSLNLLDQDYSSSEESTTPSSSTNSLSIDRSEEADLTFPNQSDVDEFDNF